MKAGFEDADTVARFLQDANMQNVVRGGVILIDEASLLGTHALAEVMDKAEALKARLILVGDPRQHASVSRGSAFPATRGGGIAAGDRSDGDSTAERQVQESCGRPECREGRWRDSISSMLPAGVREIPDGEREQVIARDYLAAISEKKGNEFKTAIVVSPTHTEAEGITVAIRSAMKEAGKAG